MTLSRVGLSICVVVCLIVVASNSNELGNEFDSQMRCYPMQNKLCADIYNMTMFPNSLGHKTAEEASKQIDQFSPLIKVKCSPDLQRFLCSLYFPICNKFQVILKPCRGLCESARNSCLPLMRKFAFNWPRTMECSQFPRRGDENEVCISKEKRTTPLPETTRPPIATSTPYRYPRYNTSSPYYTRWRPSATSPPPYCPSWRQRMVTSELTRVIDRMRVPQGCKTKFKNNLLGQGSQSGSASISIDGRLRRIDRMLGTMTSQLRLLTVNNKARRMLDNIRRSLRNMS